MSRFLRIVCIGVMVTFILCAQVMANDGCGGPTPKNQTNNGKPAGGDVADDTVDVSTYDGIILHPSGYAPVAILQNGYYGYTASLLERLKEPYAVHDLSLPPETVDDHPILIIPTGGLFGLEGSLLVKQRLAEYAAKGGTIICFTQQQGYEFSALPGGNVNGFGWREDQSCWRGGAYIDLKHPVFAGQDTVSVDANIDGYFTQWPDNAVTLLRRTKNSMPVIVTYPWGKGRVIATTFYSDQGFVTNHIAQDELDLIRDMITWVKNPISGTMTEFEQGIGNVGQVALPIVNNSQTKAEKVKITTLNPDHSTIGDQVLPATLSPGNYTTVNFEQNIPSAQGIYHLNYTLLDANDNPVQPGIEGAIFSVCKKLDTPKITNEFSFGVQSELERYPKGSDIKFTFFVWNHTDATRTITTSFSFPYHHLTGNGSIIVPPNDKGTFVYTLCNANRPMDRLWASFYDENGKGIGGASRTFWTEEASCNVKVSVENQKYQRGEIVPTLITVRNNVPLSYDATVNLTINSVADGILSEQNLNCILPANGSWTQMATFTLPIAMAGGICLVNAIIYTKDGKIGEAITTFNVPRAIITIDPILPAAFDYTSTISFKVTNVGALSLPPGTLAVTFRDSGNNLIWAGTQTYGTLSLAGSTTLDFNLNLPQLRLEETYRLAYSLLNGFTTLEGELNIPCSVVIKPSFNKPSYRIREGLEMNLKLLDTGRFREELAAVVTVPDCNFTATQGITLLPTGSGSLTYHFTVPETTLAGRHPIQVTLMMGTSSLIKDFSFTIPKAEIVFNINKLNCTSPDTGTFTLSNIGGVDESYGYIVRVIDKRGTNISNSNGTITIRAGEVYQPIEIDIPEQALDGGYTLAVLTTDSKGQQKNFYRPIYITGISARLNISPEKKLFLDDEQVRLISQINNLNNTIKEATFTVKVFSSVSEWLCHTQVNDICDIAADVDSIWLATPGGVRRYERSAGKWTTYTAIDGLASNDVTSIAVDGRFVWCGTGDNGVSRYDRLNNSWKTFTKADGLTNNEVTSIAVGTDTVWIGSWDGASRYNKTDNSWVRYRVAETQPGNFINDIVVDGDYLWFATYEGVRRYDRRNNNWLGYTTQDGLANNQVCSIGVDGNYLWFGAPNGLVTQYDKANDLFGIFITSNNREENRVNSIAVGTSSVWFASNRGVTQYDKVNNLWKTFTSQDGLVGNQTKAVLIDDGTVLAGGSDGLNKYTPSTPWATYTTGNGLADNEVTSIAPDNDVVWLGTVRGGLNRYQTGSFENLTGTNYVKAVAVDTDYVWMITVEGISRCEQIGHSISNFKYDLELLPYGGRGLDLHSLSVDTDCIWFAGYGGLIRFDKASAEFRRLAVSDNHINAIAKDDECVYIGTQQGVSRYNKITRVFTEMPQLCSIVVYSIDVDEHAVWVGTEQGLYRYDKNGDTVRRFTTGDSGLLRDDVRVVAAQAGFVWCATYAGVCRYDLENDTWQAYTTKDGLPSNLIRDIAVDSSYAYFATDHGLARIQTRGRELYQEDKRIDIAPSGATLTTNVGTISIPGKSYIEASLISRLSQVIDTSDASFQVTSKDVYLVISTDKPVYKPHEPITITATAYNRLATSTSVLSLILKREGMSVLSEGFTLPANGSRTFSVTLSAKESFTLDGFLDNEMVREHVKVMLPEIGVIINSPEVVDRNGFDISIQLHNSNSFPITIQARLDGVGLAENLGTMTLVPAQAVFIQRRCQLTQDGTVSISLSGDVERVVCQRIAFGEVVKVETEPKQLYPEGVVVVPFRLLNTGRLDSRIDVEFRLSKAGGQKMAPGIGGSEPLLPAWAKAMPGIRVNGQGRQNQAPMLNRANASTSSNELVITQTFYIPRGTITTGEIIYELTEGDYQLTHSSFFGTGTSSFRVARDNVVDMEIDIAERVTGLGEGQLPVNVLVSNLGANEFKGDLRIDTGFYQDMRPLELAVGQTATLTFTGTPTVTGGTYTVIGQVFHNGQVIFSRSRVFELIPEFSLEEIPSDISFSVGEKGTISFRVKNNGSGEGQVFVRLKIADLIDETKPVWIKSQDAGTISFNISLPDDIEDRDYNGYLTLKTKERELVERIIPFHVSGVRLSVNAWLNKMLYTTGETAVLTIAVSNLNPQVVPDMYAKIQLGGYEKTSTFTLTTGTTTVSFQVPVSFDGRKLFYGIYLSSGRSIHLNTLYLYQQKDLVNIYANEQIFKAGATITLTAIPLVKGTLTISTIEGYSLSYFLDGTTTIEYKLPEVLTSGTYRFSYTFVPVSLPAAAPSALASLAPGGNIQDELKIDVSGYQAKVLESMLDKAEYQPGSRVDLRLKIELNKPISGVLRGWIVDPAWSATPFFEQMATLTTGESIIELTGTLNGRYAGAYKLAYGLYMIEADRQGAPSMAPAGATGMLLSSGAEAFDVTLSPEIILISPTAGQAGVLVTVHGCGFGSGEDIRIDFGTTMTVVTAAADTTGSFTTAFTVTSQPTSGTITITAAGYSSGTSATGCFVLEVIGGTESSDVVHHIVIEPSAITVIEVEMLGTHAFTAQGYAMDGSPLLSGGTYTWMLSQGIGVLSTTTGQSVIFTASGIGTGTLQATALFGTSTAIAVATITVVAGQPYRVQIEPGTTMIEAKGTASFTARAYNQYGSYLSSITGFNWQVKAGSGTTVPAAGQSVVLRTTDDTGTLILTAQTSTITGTVTIEVVHGSVTTLDIAPSSIEVEAGTSRLFEAQAANQYGHKIPGAVLSYVWQTGGISGGTISQSAPGTATLTAGTRTTAGWVRVEAQGKNATAAVTIIPGPAAKLAILGTSTANPGIPLGLVVQTQDRYGNIKAGTMSLGVTLSAVNGAMFCNLAAGAVWTATDTVTIAANSSESGFFFKYNGTATPVTITAASDNLAAATLAVTIEPLGSQTAGQIIGDDGRTGLLIGTGTIIGTGYIEITSTVSTTDQTAVDAANAADTADSRINQVKDSLRCFNVLGVSSTFTTTGTITIPYEEAGGFVRDTCIREGRLKIYRLTQVSTGVWRWVEVTGSKVDINTNTVSAPVTHLSCFILMGSPEFEPNLEKVLVYPNPFYADRHVLIYFDRLSQDSTIRIFTITGELVSEIRADSSRVGWDARNSAGEKVASGIYIFLINDPVGNKKVGKLGVLR